MHTNHSSTAPTTLPLYRTRLFWGIVFGVFFIFSSILFINFLDTDGGSYTLTFDQVFDSFNLAYGAMLFMLYGFKIGDPYGYLGSITYFVLILFFVYKTFQKSQVILWYPVTVSALYITGIIALHGLNGF